MEHQQLEGWRWSRPGDRILDIGESPQPVPNLKTWTTWGFFVDPTWNYAHKGSPAWRHMHAVPALEMAQAESD